MGSAIDKTDAKTIITFSRTLRNLCKGVRQETLRRLLLLGFYMRLCRYHKVYKELCIRTKQEHLLEHKSFDNYLFMIDEKEMRELAKWLGVSERVIRDYVKTLQKLTIYVFL